MKRELLEAVLQVTFDGTYCRNCGHSIDDHYAEIWPKLPPISCGHEQCGCRWALGSDGRWQWMTRSKLDL